MVFVLLQLASQIIIPLFLVYLVSCEILVSLRENLAPNYSWNSSIDPDQRSYLSVDSLKVLKETSIYPYPWSLIGRILSQAPSSISSNILSDHRCCELQRIPHYTKIRERDVYRCCFPYSLASRNWVSRSRFQFNATRCRNGIQTKTEKTN